MFKVGDIVEFIGDPVYTYRSLPFTQKDIFGIVQEPWLPVNIRSGRVCCLLFLKSDPNQPVSLTNDNDYKWSFPIQNVILYRPQVQGKQYLLDF